MQIGANVFAKNDLELPSARSVLPPILTPERNLAVDWACRQEATLPPDVNTLKFLLTICSLCKHEKNKQTF